MDADSEAIGDMFGTAPAALSRPRRPGHGRPVHLSGYDRKSRDFYATPSWVTEALLRHVTLRGPFWRAAALMSEGPWSAVIALTHRIRWFEMGERTNTAQHHHAWVVFDFARTEAGPPALLFAD